MTQGKKVDKLASAAGINLTFELSDEVVPTKIAKDQEKEVEAAISIYDFIDTDMLTINRKKVVEMAPYQIVFLGNPKKINRVSVSSMILETGLVLGKRLEDKTLKRYTIMSAVKKLDVRSENDENIGFLLACLSEPTFYGSVNAKAPYLFKIVSIKKEQEKKEKTASAFFRAVDIINQASKNQKENLGILLGIPAWKMLSEADRADALKKLCEENPQAIIDAASKEDQAELLLFHSAKDSKVIVEKNGIYRYQKYDLGATVTDCVRWLKQNDTIAQLIRSELNA